MAKSPVFVEPRDISNLDDCLFYHTMEIPGFGTIPGYWDIRGNESQYLGGEPQFLGESPFNKKRVLEIGPASGQLTFYMERHGAEVVSVEAIDESAWDLFWDFYDVLPSDLQEVLAERRTALDQVKNSYWFCHRALSSQAKVHYGNAYHLPHELGQFDISVLSCVLLHNKNPLRILENCARVTGETIIIVEPLREQQFSQTSAEFLPSGDRRWWDTWWGFSPKFFVDLLRSMGFIESRVTFHTQTCFGKPADLFTVVATRSAFNKVTSSEQAIDVVITCPVERIRLEKDSLTHLPIRIVNQSAVEISSFSSPPILMSYHWKRRSGEIVVWDGIRTSFPRIIHPGDDEEMFVSVRAPQEPGDYFLEITMVKEGVKWYESEIAGLPVVIDAAVS